MRQWLGEDMTTPGHQSREALRAFPMNNYRWLGTPYWTQDIAQAVRIKRMENRNFGSNSEP